MQTQAGQVLGTRASMSPEQAAGSGAVGPASDVYGLGAILYHLLTGKVPFSGAQVSELIDAVCHTPPVPPRKHWPGVPAALEAVCLKALAKAPEQRYDSADALAADVQRWRDDEPVSVYPDPLSTRLLRRARRNKPAVAGLGALVVTAFVALSVGLAVVSTQQQRARDAEREANRNALRAQANEQKARVALDRGLKAISTALMRLARPDLRDVPGLQPVRSELLDQAVSSYDEILRVWGDEPSVRADAFLGMYLAAATASEMGDDRRALDVVESQAHLANLCRDGGKLKEAESLYASALAIREKRLSGEHPALAAVLADYAALLRKLGRKEEAETLAQRARKIRSRAED